MKHIHLRRTLCALLCGALLFGCLAAMPASAADAAGLTPTRVISTFYGDSSTTQGFHWATKADGGSIVRIYEAGSELYRDFEGSSSLFQSYYGHSVVAEGLKAGTDYEYQVGDRTANVWSEKGYFTTNPGAGSAFSFIALADVQSSNLANFEGGAAVLANALQQNPDASFQVNLGDYTDDSDNDQWDWFFQAFAGLNTQLTHAPVAGNHDGNLKWNWFKNMFTLQEQPNSSNLTGTYYSFDYGDAHFSVLNTNDMYPISQQQRNWLANDMKQSGAKWKILLMHRAAYSAGKNINKPDTLIMRNILLPIIEDCGIDLVLTGHDHMYYRSAPVKGDAFAGATATTTALPGYDLELAGGGGGKAVSYTDPGAPIHIVPSTAGPKRYRVYAAMSPILDLAEECFQPEVPVYSTVSVDGGQLVYKAFVYDAETDAATLFDQLTINKTSFAGAVPNYKPLATDYISTAPAQFISVIWEVTRCLFQDYLFKLLPQALGLN
ncbi:MAG: metallophosphoesterase family protein [Oscillospiraceae bacterium]|jgi:hypothetical protein|nr:metallophosphoesterase family protein [Oscillospiraceae bacterium]